MIAYHEEGNLNLQQPFKSKKDVHRIAAYNAIMTWLVAKGLNVDLQILDNEASAAYNQVITEKWKASFQLVPPGVH
jgi:trans-aconitate methyltransferase